MWKNAVIIFFNSWISHGLETANLVTRSSNRGRGCVWGPKTMKSVVYLSHGKNKNLSPSWEIGWATKNLLYELDYGDFTQLAFTFTFLVLFWNMFVIDEWHFFLLFQNQVWNFPWPESLVLSLDKQLMTGYIWYFAIHRKSWTDSS